MSDSERRERIGDGETIAREGWEEEGGRGEGEQLANC